MQHPVPYVDVRAVLAPPDPCRCPRPADHDQQALVCWWVLLGLLVTACLLLVWL